MNFVYFGYGDVNDMDTMWNVVFPKLKEAGFKQVNYDGIEGFLLSGEEKDYEKVEDIVYEVNQEHDTDLICNYEDYDEELEAM